MGILLICNRKVNVHDRKLLMCLTRNFNIPTRLPPRAKTLSIWTFEDWIIQIPVPSGQNGV